MGTPLLVSVDSDTKLLPDQVRTALVSDLVGTFGPFRNPRVGSGIAWLGDSITRGLGSTNNGDSVPPILSGTDITVAGNSIATYAMLYSGGRLLKTVNAGISGNTTAQMLARVQTDVVAYKPAVCVVLGGTNDSAAPVSLANFASNITGIVVALRKAAILPVLCTIPTINSAPQRAIIIGYNNWLRRYASQQGITLLDYYPQTVDPATGNLLQTAMGNADGTHPGDIGYASLGKYAADTLAPMVGASAIPIASDNTDAANLLQDGLFLGNVSNGIASGWSVYGTMPSGATTSVVTDPLVPGKMQQIDAASTSGGAVVYQRITPVAGRRLAFSGVITKTAGQCSIQAYVNSTDGKDTYNLILDVTQPVTRGRFYTEWVVPANVASIDVKFYTQPGTMTLSVGQMTVYDITAQAALA